MKTAKKFMLYSIILGLFLFFIGLAQSYVSLYPENGITMANILLVLGTIMIVISSVVFALYFVYRFFEKEERTIAASILPISMTLVTIFMASVLFLTIIKNFLNSNLTILISRKNIEIISEILSSKVFWSATIIFYFFVSIFFIFIYKKIKHNKKIMI